MSRDAILLLGGTGFIGSALARRLRQEEARVYVFGRHDGERLEQVLPQCGTIIHLASSTTPGSSATHPDLELGNIALSLHLLELIQKQSKTHLVFFSSGGTVYGNPGQLPVTEDAPIAPLSNYGSGKASQESFFQTFRDQGNAVTILRPSNAYGPGQNMRNGFGLVRTMLECARVGRPMEIWGDGNNVRDFIYIDDIVDVCAQLITRPDDNETYNLGSGAGHSINQLHCIVEQVTGKALATKHHSARGIDVRAVVLDNTRLAATLAWSPKTMLEDGVKKTWEWVTQQP